MDAERWTRLQTLFDEGADLSPEAQVEWLAGISRSDPELVDELRRWLTADRNSDALPLRIERYATTAAGVLRLEPGDQVGRYTVEGLLGVGGMGAVYRARRSDDAYDQQVVIKVVDAAPDAELARLFERERQILADLVHPNIARLLDGGALPSGHPYLVMEFVDGEDIASHCDRAEVGLERRLDLFIDVCRAVQFAHSNLIVHRDIKPDNVMVDRNGNVRLLDFGIATLLDADAGSAAAAPSTAERNAGNESRTLKGAMLSPAYASPEQHRRQPVTTASDIYSLGVLLYQLLSGTLPDRESLSPPSAVLGKAGDNPGARRLRGDLDAIVLCALRDDPDQRYPTVNAMIQDLRRFLKQRPIEARRNRWTDHLRLFVRRSRGLALSLLAIVVMVLGFSLGVTALAIKLDAQRQRAMVAAETTERVAEFMVELFAAADPEQHRGKQVSARELLDRGQQQIREQLSDQPAIKAQLLHRMAGAYRNLGLNDQAEPLYQEALAVADVLPQDLRLRIELERADLVREIGRGAEAIERLATLIEVLDRTPARADLRAKAYNDYGLALALEERFEESERWSRKALDVALPPTSENQIRRTRFRHNLALALARLGRLDESIALFETVVEEKRAQLGAGHPSLLLSLESLAGQHRRRGQLDAAAAIFEQARAQRLKLYGPDSSSLAGLDNELANVHHDAGRYHDAERAYRNALDYYQRNPDVDVQGYAYVVNNLASLYEDSGDLARAEPLFRESLRMRIMLNGEFDISVVRVRINLARMLISAGALDQAEQELDRVDAILAEHYPDNQFRAAQAMRQRALLASARGAHRQARALMREALAAIEPGQAASSLTLLDSRLDAARIELAGGDAERAQTLLDQVDSAIAGNFAVDHPRRLSFRVCQLEVAAARGQSPQPGRLADLERALLARLHPEAPVIERLRALRQGSAGDA